MVIDGDNFIQKPWAELEKVEEFLDLSHELAEDNFYFNATKGFFCGHQVITQPESEWSCTRTKCLSKSKGREKPPVSLKLLNVLTYYFTPHNKIFFQQNGKYDFDWK